MSVVRTAPRDFFRFLPRRLKSQLVALVGLSPSYRLTTCCGGSWLAGSLQTLRVGDVIARPDLHSGERRLERHQGGVIITFNHMSADVCRIVVQ